MSGTWRTLIFLVNAGWCAAGFAFYADTHNPWWLVFAVVYCFFALLGIVSLALYDIKRDRDD